MAVEKKPGAIDAILLCGGTGGRLHPLTHDLVPKSLTELSGKKLIEYTVDSLDPSIINKLILAVGHHDEQITAWAKNALTAYDFDLSYQTLPGIYEAVQAALEHSSSDMFMVANTDEVRTGLDIRGLVSAALGSTALATMLVGYSNHLYRHRLLDISAEGIILASDLKSDRFKNDDQARGPVNAGITVFKRAARDYFDKEDSGWSGLLDTLIENGQMNAFVVPALGYHNIGTPEEFTFAGGSGLSIIFCGEDLGAE